jgi:hypothetical protein
MDDLDFDYFDDDTPKVCSLSDSTDRSDLDLLKELSKGSRYFCRTCKRPANDSQKLCSPELLR